MTWPIALQGFTLNNCEIGIWQKSNIWLRQLRAAHNKMPFLYSNSNMVKWQPILAVHWLNLRLNFKIVHLMSWFWPKCCVFFWWWLTLSSLTILMYVLYFVFFVKYMLFINYIIIFGGRGSVKKWQSMSAWCHKSTALYSILRFSFFLYRKKWNKNMFLGGLLFL